MFSVIDNLTVESVKLYKSAELVIAIYIDGNFKQTPVMIKSRYDALDPLRPFKAVKPDFVIAYIPNTCKGPAKVVTLEFKG